jgi:Arc/MetJ family transcription regulator
VNVRTRIEIDAQLLTEAMAATGHTTTRATVEAALRALIRLHRQIARRMAMAGLGWEGDLDAMREGRAHE